jgi:putative toxin-antitoxin system antitoxin component (TIGR02293 family)
MKKRSIRKNEEFIMLGLKENKTTSLHVINEAIRVFGDEGRAYSWLSKPNKTLENHIPLELLETSEGKDQVLERLVQIDHGIYI